MKTYPEMNETVKDLLRRSNEPMSLYILARLEELENQVQEFTMPNVQLTPKELQGMEGEPMWEHNFYNGWVTCRVVEYTTSEAIFFTDGSARRIDAYGDGWLAYRHKPEAKTQRKGGVV